MTWTTLLLFLPACFALNLTPGPNNLLSMNNGRQYGVSVALAAGAGRLVAFAAMIALAASGLAVVLYSSQFLFTMVKTLGALYLLWIAFQLWRSSTSLLSENKTMMSTGALFRQEFFLAAGNPKAILIFTAFLPQFVDTAQPIALQFFWLGSGFLLLEVVSITLYALSGRYLRHWFDKPAMSQRFNRACAFILAGFGTQLILSEQGT